MIGIDQNLTPIFDAVKKYVEDKVTQFHVPGHKQGRGLKELADYIGYKALCMDANGMDDLDYINNPTGVIAQAEELYARAFGSSHAFLLVNGTTSGVQAMIMSACSPGDEIILPRNAHKSAIGGVILSGAVPVYVQPEINEELGIAMGVSEESIKTAIEQHPAAKAVLLINPTYYGFTSDIKAIVKLAHRHGITVLVDEAHGAHMAFHGDLPLTAMQAGADMSAASMHKTAGSMTQSSILLLKSNTISPAIVRQVLNLSYTSSASYLLLSSLDIARRQLAIEGREMLDKTIQLAEQARNDINQIKGLYAFGSELTGSPGCFDFDKTKLSVNVRELGLTGYQMETILRQKYNIQIELADLYNIMAIVTLADRPEDLQALVGALRDIALRTNQKGIKNSTRIPHNTEMITSPRDAFYSPKKVVKLEDAVGEIAGENIMAYPPGIPVVCMGELITADIVEYIEVLKTENCELQGTSDPQLDYVRVLADNESGAEAAGL